MYCLLFCINIIHLLSHKYRSFTDRIVLKFKTWAIHCFIDALNTYPEISKIRIPAMLTQNPAPGPISIGLPSLVEHENEIVDSIVAHVVVAPRQHAFLEHVQVLVDAREVG